MKKLGMFLTLMLALTMVCHRVFAQSVTITLMPGWNWISVPLMDTLDFETAMGTFTPVSGDIIKSRWGQSFYNGNRWMGSLSQFFPGYGYMYKSNRTMPVMVTFNAQQPVPQVVVTTSEPMLITGNSAMSGGNVTSSNGDYVSLIVRGICWSTHQDPTLNDNFIEVGNSMGNFTAPMTGLNISTTYYVRAYAVTPSGTVFGEQQSFTTRDGIPTLTTDSITSITEESATSGGNITDDGGLNITARGVCWSTSPNPTVSDNHTTDGTGTGNFSSSITGLEIITTYFVRAYATTNAGTAYGNEVSFTTEAFPTGAIDGKFTINASGDQVYFSQGNLQYIGSASTPYWKFADNQWDYLGDNGQFSEEHGVDRDLFCWATSGFNHGAVCYQPWSTNVDANNYYAYGSLSFNLYDQTGQADWGYNDISNGGNAINQWRTLTKDEWIYVFTVRSTVSGVRYAKAKVNDVKGVILLPDNWSTNYYSLVNTNNGNASFNSNTITESIWLNSFESHGAVFLPAAGYRNGVNGGPGPYSAGFYWSSSSYGGQPYAYGLGFTESVLNDDSYGSRGAGQSVRLVKACNH